MNFQEFKQFTWIELIYLKNLTFSTFFILKDSYQSLSLTVSVRYWMIYLTAKSWSKIEFIEYLLHLFTA